MIFRNHNNMLICCSRNISDYYQYWKPWCCTIFLKKQWYILFFYNCFTFQDSQMNRKFKEQHLFEVELFCNVINACCEGKLCCVWSLWWETISVLVRNSLLISIITIVFVWAGLTSDPRLWPPSSPDLLRLWERRSMLIDHETRCLPSYYWLVRGCCKLLLLKEDYFY